jgi:large subunit ribosomal protein L30e
MSTFSGADLERQLKAVTKTGKYVVGRREVLGSLKGSKLVVWSASANVPPQILNECKTLQVPAIRFDGNPIELGRTCGIPYKVSVIAVKSPGDAVLSSFESSKDYSEQRSAIFQSSLATRKDEPQEEHAESKPSKKKKETEESVKAGEKKAAKEKTAKKAKRETKKKDEEEMKDSKTMKKSEKKTTKKGGKKKKDDKDVEKAEQTAEAEEDKEEDED